ncbi:class I SAM-dependent methyltransferase [Pseudomonas benzenivorans]|uniref:Class I SAM-dependent methyltransferase n=1 Tax=Pseudomonas benzenivorans TaxID=556533 RepID=A0ABY5HBC4_9PSED|nr:class I SAM-dependent methyltransferase [Pseudomonas benzenivorans]UTW09643.1 class I SAM-dependent methyltransferase [Pseudomonas benzenivorans]
MSSPTKPNEPWDESTANWYATHYGDWPTTCMPIQAETWRPDEALVDIGCGTGSSLRHLTALCPQGRLVGIEPSPAMLAIAQQQTQQLGLGARIEFYCAAAEALPLADASMDSVLAFSSFHHWQDAALGLREVLRVLKPNGRLLLSEEPEILRLHGIILESLQQQLQAAGFSPPTQRLLTQDAAACHLIVARKPALGVLDKPQPPGHESAPAPHTQEAR